MAVLGWALLVYLHYTHLSSIPGLHYDEAWAYNFSWKIAAGASPFTAMSPYTSPWTHYFAAMWLLVTGPSLEAFRASQITLALTGLGFLCAALPKHVRSVFPWACLALPGLILNHRFAVELTGFHVLCFGLLCWSLRREKWALACVAALLGTTAHILFYGVALGLLGAVLLEGFRLPKHARLGAMVYFAFTAAFFLRVAFLIPEKGKAIALVASAVAAFGMLALHAERWTVWKWGRAPAALLALVFLVTATCFSAGIWTSSIYSGIDICDSWAFALPALAGWAAVGALSLASWMRAPRILRNWFLLGLPLLGLMMLKPAPRYYELAMLALACLISLQVGTSLVMPKSNNPSLPRSFALAVLLLALFGALKVSITLAARAEIDGVKDRRLRYFVYKDSSRDFLDKQSLARFLGGSGCARGDIQTHDPRLKEELDALALGDWEVASGTKCLYDYVALHDEPGASGKPYGEFLVREK